MCLFDVTNNILYNYDVTHTQTVFAFLLWVYRPYGGLVQIFS